MAFVGSFLPPLTPHLQLLTTPTLRVPAITLLSPSSFRTLPSPIIHCPIRLMDSAKALNFASVPSREEVRLQDNVCDWMHV